MFREQTGSPNGRFPATGEVIDTARTGRYFLSDLEKTESPPASRSTPWNGRQIGRHTSELQSLMRISYAVFCLKKKKQKIKQNTLRWTVSMTHNTHHTITTSPRNLSTQQT